MSDSPSYEQLVALVERLNAQLAELAARNAELERIVTAQAWEITELKRRLPVGSSNSSRPPSSDAPWAKQPAKQRSARGQPGSPGKEPGFEVEFAEPGLIPIGSPRSWLGVAAAALRI